MLFLTYPPLTIATIASFFTSWRQGEAEGIDIIVVVVVVVADLLTSYRP
jgi:hypothetical protein